MAYHFGVMPRICMAIAQADRFPITDILRQTPDIPVNCQWAMFLRNHDELTLNGDRYRARLSLVHLRHGPARAPQPWHQTTASLADGQRAAQDRAHELAADVVPGHADHLLRRRDRHG